MVISVPRVRFAGVAVALAALPAVAAPPPPPPSYVAEVAKLLNGSENASTTDLLAKHVANDVRVYVNDTLVADNKAAWTRRYALLQRQHGSALAYSEGWKDGGSLMIADQFDTVDRSNLPQDFVADPRYATRAVFISSAWTGRFMRSGSLRPMVSGSGPR